VGEERSDLTKGRGAPGAPRRRTVRPRL